jgi:hypothetical protein
LLALAIGCGAFCGVYQARQKTLARGWVMKAVFGAVIAAVVAAAAVAFVLATP